MISQTTLDASIAGLTAAVAAATVAIQDASAATPDATVQALVDSVDLQTAALTAALTPPAPPTPVG